jgi:Flp pilus assembly protein TadG
MTIWAFIRDSRAASAVEFALTAPVFFLMTFGTIEGGMLIWTQVGLQHGAEMAARCASINANLCNTTGSIQTYAAQQAYGLNPPPTTFSVSAAACGNQVSASYTFSFLTSFFPAATMAISAQACFPS